MTTVKMIAGDTFKGAFTGDVFGDGGVQSVTIQDGSSVIFRSGGFGGAGAVDAIAVTGAAVNFTIKQDQLNGSNVVLTSLLDGITITVPIGTNGTNIVFENGDSRLLIFNAGTNTISLGGVPVTAVSPATQPVPPGASIYSVTGAVQQIEGADYTFIAHRTSDGVNAAQALTFNVQGDTNNGTVVAATTGADFNTAAGNTVTFLAGQLDSVPFTVHLNTDNLVEGLEGLKIQLFSGATVLATTTGLIADANKVGQTFTLTGNIDTVGSGTAVDLVGSEGSTSVVGQDTVIITENTANIFDNVNGGPDRDRMIVLDAGTFFTTAPNFTNIVVTNVEALQYTSVRGLFNGVLNTTAWTGLDSTTLNLNSGATQTLISSPTVTVPAGTITITNAGTGGVTLQGGSGVLAITASQAGNVNVGQDGSSNTLTAATVTGGNTVNITDNGTQELTTVALNGFAGNTTLTGNLIATVGITNILGGSHQATVNTTVPLTVALSNIIVTDFDLTSSNTNLLTVNSNGGAGGGIQGTNGTAFSGNSGMGDISAGGNIVINAANGFSFFADINTNGSTVTLTDVGGGSISGDDVQGGALATLNVNGSTGGGFYFDQLDGTNTALAVFSVNVTGNAYLQANNVIEAAGGSVITSTSSQGVQILNQLGNNTLFNGSGDTGNDYANFGSTIRQNTFGGGSDFVDFSAGLMGSSGAPAVFGSINGGTSANDFDQFRISQANAQSLTAQGNFLSNFEQAILTGGSANLVTHTVNTANLGFSGNTNIVVTGNNSANATPEVVTFTFTGTASGQIQGSAATTDTADTFLFDGVLTKFNDGATAAQMGADFAATYGVGPNWTAVDLGGGVVQVTKNAGGAFTDLTTAGVKAGLTDVNNIGAPSGTVVTTVPGVTTVVGVKEVGQLTLNNVAVANTETITVTDGTNSFTFTNTTGGTLLGSNGSPGNPATNTQLATAFVTAFNNAANILFFPSSAVSYTASVSASGNIVFTADQAGAKPDLVLNGPTSTGLTTPADDYSMVAPGSVGSPAGTQQGVTAVAGNPESFTYTVVGAGNGKDSITFTNGTVTAADDTVITLDGSENTNEAVAAKIAAGVYQDYTITYVPGSNVVTFTTKTNVNTNPDITTAAFQVFDDTNVSGAPQVVGGPAVPGPDVTVSAPTVQGDVGGLVLNNVTNNSNIELQGNGLHTINLANSAGAADVVNLFLSGHTTDTVTMPGVETLNLNVGSYVVPGTDTLTVVDTSLTTLKLLAGNDALVLTHTGTALTTLDASLLANGITWTSGALANAVTVSTGSAGNSSINLLAATKSITFIGGNTNDTLVLNNASNTNVSLGGGNDTVTTGTGLTNSISTGSGNDVVNVTQTLNGNSYSKVSDFAATKISTVGGDTIHFQDGTGTFNAVQVPTLQNTASFQDYLDAAAAGGPGTIRWFQFTSGVGANGNTYIVDDNSAATTFQNGIDNVIELTGLHDGSVAALGNLALAAGINGNVSFA